jgi:hypothetical protein
MDGEYRGECGELAAVSAVHPLSHNRRIAHPTNDNIMNGAPGGMKMGAAI